MMAYSIILIISAAVVSTCAEYCLWTECLPQRIATGCWKYDMTENTRQSCRNHRWGTGLQYHCCAKQSSPSLTFDQFSQAVTSNGYPAPSQEQYENFNASASEHGRIYTTQEAAMALAQILYESDGLRVKSDYTCAQTNCPGRYVTPGCDAPEQYYYGRGYIQLSGCYNYRDASLAIFNDTRLVTDPDQMATNDGVAWQTSFWYWSTQVHDKRGVKQGHFGATTKAISGGVECSAPGNIQAQARFRLYENVRQAFGVAGTADPSGCP